MLTVTDIIVWSTALNLFTIGLLIIAFRRIGAGSLKNAFIAVIVNLIVWTNLVLFVKQDGLDYDTALLVFKLMFATISILTVSINFFAVAFCRESRLHHWPFIVLAANSILLALLSFSDFIVAGLNETPGGWVPAHGPLHKYWVISISAFSLYALWRLLVKYREDSDRVLTFQIRILFWTGLCTALATIITNGLLPAFFETSNFFAAGAAWPIFFLFGVAVLITNGENIYLMYSFRALLKKDSFDSKDNFYAVLQTIGLLDFVTTDEPEQFERKISLLKGDKTFPIYFSNQQTSQIAPSVAGLPDKVFQERLYGGLLANLHHLENENRYLAFRMIKMERQIEDHSFDTDNRLIETKHISAPKGTLGEEHRISDYVEALNRNLADNQSKYGIPFLCFSTELFRTLQELEKLASTPHILAVEGGVGVGKYTLVQAAHHLNQGQKLVALRGIASPPGHFAGAVQEAKADIAAGKVDGICIRNIDRLPEDCLPFLYDLLDECAHKVRFYYTAAAGSLATNSILQELHFRHPAHSVTVPDLKDRPDDVFYQVLYATHQWNERSTGRFQSVSNKAIKQALAYHWPGNSGQVGSVVIHSMLDEHPPRLNRLQIQGQFQTSPNLSPLEEAERTVIVRFLTANDYNQNQTRKDLDISTNTLRAKIEKYGIEIPRS